MQERRLNLTEWDPQEESTEPLLARGSHEMTVRCPQCGHRWNVSQFSRCPCDKRSRQLTREERDRVWGVVARAKITRKKMQWPAIRARVVRHADSRCVDCGAEVQHQSMGHVHHLLPRSRGGLDAIENLVYLCAYCHAARHEGEGQGEWGKLLRVAARRTEAI